MYTGTGVAAFTTANMGVLSHRTDKVQYWDKAARKPVDGDGTFSASWEKRSKVRGKPNQVPGWTAGDTGSTLKPPEYMKLGGPWIDGKDPAGASVKQQNLRRKSPVLLCALA